MPRWKFANRSLVAAAERAGTGAGADGSGGDRARHQVRLRNPLGQAGRVVPPVAGELAAAAACQPWSDGVAQATSLTSGVPVPFSGWLADQPLATPLRPRRNQSDSTASKIGSLFSVPVAPAGGITTSEPGPSRLDELAERPKLHG